MILRAALPQDAAALSAIAQAAKRHWGYPESWLRRWTAALTITEPYLVGSSTWIAIEDDRMVGFASATQQGDVATLDHLWVRPGAMGRGIGRSLFHHLEHIVLLAGASILKATSDPHAEAFYQRMGMLTVGKEPASMDGHERYLALMQKSLTRRGSASPLA